MITFKEFIWEKALNEWVHPNVTHRVLNTLQPDMDKIKKSHLQSDHFFGGSMETPEHSHEASHTNTTRPLTDEGKEKSDTHKKIEKVLGKEVSHTGETTDKHGRKVRLNKVLDDKELLKKFNDEKASSGYDGVDHVSYSRGVHHEVYGKSSHLSKKTGNHTFTSCQRVSHELSPHQPLSDQRDKESDDGMQDGARVEGHINGAIHHEIVASVKNKDGDVIGRVTARKYEADVTNPETGKKEKHHIWRTGDTAHYGTMAPHHRKQIDAHLEKSFPAKKDVEYRVSGSSSTPQYDDGGGNTHVERTEEGMQKILASSDDNAKKKLIHEKGTPGHILHELAKDKKNHFYIPNHENTQSHTLSHILKHGDKTATYMLDKIAQHKNLSQEDKMNLSTNKESYVRRSVIERKDNTPEQIHHMIDHEAKQKTHLMGVIAERHDLDDSHVDKIIHSGKGLEDLAQNPSTKKHHLMKLAEHKDEDVASSVCSNPSSDKDVLEHAFNHHRNSKHVIEQLVSHKNTPDHILNHIYDHGSSLMKYKLTDRKDLPKETVEKLVKKGDHSSAITQKNLTQDHISHIIDHGDEDALSRISQRPDLKQSHVEEIVKKRTRDPYMIHKHLLTNHKDKLTPEHLHTMATSQPYDEVAKKLLSHRNLTSESLHAIKKSNEDDHGIQKLVKAHPNYKP